jgi:putative ABC transport system permease protein
MVSIARKNLFQDKKRFVITLNGLAVALVLIFLTTGGLIGVLDNSVIIVDHTHADIWVTQKGVSDLLGVPSLIQENQVQQLGGIDGVKDYNEIINYPGMIDINGTPLKIVILGYNLTSGVGAPWSMASGNINDLRQNDTIIVDQSIEAKYNKQLTGESVLVGGIPQKVVGISTDSKWFTYPMIFTTYENAQKLCRFTGNQTNYALVEVQPNNDPLKVSKDIAGIDGVNALTSSQIRDNTRNWIIFDSGAGMGLLISAAVGWAVATIVVTLTIYTVTMERIPEFGTLKAIGASKRDVYKILLEQVFVSVTFGYAAGVICGYIAAAVIEKITLLSITITTDILVITFFLTLLLSILGSIMSARKVNKVDPAIVFRS